jgi:toxin ParE1/3/4
VAAARRVSWSAPARRDLDELGDYISRDSPRAAQRVTDEIIDRAAHLDLFAERGRRVLGFADVELREVFVHRYRIVYQVTNDEVLIAAVVHGARDFGSWVRSLFEA